MEEKRRESSGTPPPPAADIPDPSPEPLPSSRRRGGGQKRKLSSINSGSASHTKRQARERPPPVPFAPIHANGPWTRARVQPINGGSEADEALVVKSESIAREGDGKAEEMQVAEEDWEALEAKIESEYEAIRSRGEDVHVVPVHAGWFSWTKIHELEKKTLPSFFNGKSETRTPEIYMEIRDWIMKKFHQNPNSQIELEHLSDLTVGDLDARQEVMEFLDYWGLINYHPFPRNETTAAVTVDAEETEKTDSLVEKLFLFETEESSTPVVTSTNSEKPAVSSGLFPESLITEELVKSEGPDVEYHCNSCSADCSRKRYHCQKQADYDLCAECFTNGKFDSNMSPSDFILMEPGESRGANGGNWTDQENLLLLEAIEIFTDNWSEIAEHVATKTKAQCILHFLQMPIEDAFYNHDDENNKEDENLEPKPDQEKDNTAIEEIPEKIETQEGTTEIMENPNPDEIKESDNSGEVEESFALKALKEAFEVVGSVPSPEGVRLSFTEASNPVMTLAAYLVRLVEPNIATAAVRSLLKSLSSNHSSEEISARHCFCLENPPDDNKNQADLKGSATEAVKQDAQKDEEAPNLIDDEKKDSAVEECEEKKDSASDEQMPPIEQATGEAEKSPTSVKESENGASANDQDISINEKKKTEEQSIVSNSMTEKEDAGDMEALECVIEKQDSIMTEIDVNTNKLRRAAVTALSAAAVKAKLLADQEEDQIHQLATFLIEKQLYKIESKMAFFKDMESVVMRVKEQLDRSKQRLFQERAQIIAARFAMTSSSARPVSQNLPPNRSAVNFPNQASRPPFMGMNSLRPPISRPMMAQNPNSSNFIMPGGGAGSSVHPNADKFSSVGSK